MRSTARYAFTTPPIARRGAARRAPPGRLYGSRDVTPSGHDLRDTRAGESVHLGPHEDSSRNWAAPSGYPWVPHQGRTAARGGNGDPEGRAPRRALAPSVPPPSPC